MTNIKNTNPNQNNKTSWGNVAGWYDDLLEKSPDSYQEKVILPNLLRIIDPKPGQNYRGNPDQINMGRGPVRGNSQ